MRNGKILLQMVSLLLLMALISSGCSVGLVNLSATQTAVAGTILAQKATQAALEQTQTAVAATQTAMSFTATPTAAMQAESTDTPTPMPPTATHEPTDTPTVGPTGTPIPSAPAIPCVSPTIEFTNVPPYRSKGELQGRVACVEPADYKVAVYIYVEGWFNKPYLASPLTTIESDGTWKTNIALAPSDPLATKIAAFLVLNGYNPPRMEGGQTFPKELFDNAVAHVMVDREPGARNN